MAVARQCDICGGFYKRDTEPNFIEIEKRNNEGSVYTYGGYDTCPRCMESIKVHIDMLRQRGE